MKKHLLATAIIVLANLAGPVLASPINGPTSTFVEVKAPAGVNDFHIVVDVTDGNPTIRKTTGTVAGKFGTYPIPNKPTDNNVEKNGSNWVIPPLLAASRSRTMRPWPAAVSG
jgi:hypothetical protein